MRLSRHMRYQTRLSVRTALRNRWQWYKCAAPWTQIGLYFELDHVSLSQCKVSSSQTRAVHRLFPLAGMLLRRERDRAVGRLMVPPPPSPSAPPPREVAPGFPFPRIITAEQVHKSPPTTASSSRINTATSLPAAFWLPQPCCFSTQCWLLAARCSRGAAGADGGGMAGRVGTRQRAAAVGAVDHGVQPAVHCSLQPCDVPPAKRVRCCATM